MSSTEQAQEPTMEEILASIRKIISDDTAEPEQDAEESAAPAEDDDDVSEDLDIDPEPAEEEPDPLFDLADADDDVLELTDIVAEPAEEPVDDIVFDEGFADHVMAEEAPDTDEVAFVEIEDHDDPSPNRWFRRRPTPRLRTG